MDYLTRDSFFTGVSEGIIGYDRIIKMLHVHEGELVIEHKGLYSVESFLISRRLMYWQVYLHKTVICAGEMAISAIKRAKTLFRENKNFNISESLAYFLTTDPDQNSLRENRDEILHHFSKLDDTDILMALKAFSESDDFVLSCLSRGLISRKLFRVELRNEPFSDEYREHIRDKILQKLNVNPGVLSHLIFEGQEANKAYVTGSKEIMIKLANGSVKPISEWSEHNIRPQEVVKYFICYPKI
jgi:HD superfamily phosphohydrolase